MLVCEGLKPITNKVSTLLSFSNKSFDKAKNLKTIKIKKTYHLIIQ